MTKTTLKRWSLVLSLLRRIIECSTFPLSVRARMYSTLSDLASECGLHYDGDGYS